MLVGAAILIHIPAGVNKTAVGKRKEFLPDGFISAPNRKCPPVKQLS